MKDVVLLRRLMLRPTHDTRDTSGKPKSEYNSNGKRRTIPHLISCYSIHFMWVFPVLVRLDSAGRHGCGWGRLWWDWSCCSGSIDQVPIPGNPSIGVTELQSQDVQGQWNVQELLKNLFATQDEASKTPRAYGSYGLLYSHYESSRKWPQKITLNQKLLYLILALFIWGDGFCFGVIF